MLHHLGEWESPWLQTPLFGKTQKNPFFPKTETQNHAQKYCSILTYPSEHQDVGKTALWLQAPWSLCEQPLPPSLGHNFPCWGPGANVNCCSRPFRGSIQAAQHLRLPQTPMPESALACMSVFQPQWKRRGSLYLPII